MQTFVPEDQNLKGGGGDFHPMRIKGICSIHDDQSQNAIWELPIPHRKPAQNSCFLVCPFLFVGSPVDHISSKIACHSQKHKVLEQLSCISNFSLELAVCGLVWQGGNLLVLNLKSWH